MASLCRRGSIHGVARQVVGDMRGTLTLIDSASHHDARQLGMQRVEYDHQFYDVLLRSLGCATTHPTII